MTSISSAGVQIRGMASVSQSAVDRFGIHSAVNGHTCYALEGQQLLDPRDAAARPSQELLAWHSEAVFLAG